MHGNEIMNFLFPNDFHVDWSLMVVLYPYITGLVAGAFIVSSLYHVFNRDEFKPIARFALLTSLAFMLFATVPLLNHLGHPERAMSIIITPNFSSAMAGFGILYAGYLVILIIEVWLVYRVDIIESARNTTGFKRLFFKTLALGVYNTSKEALDLDRKLIKIFAAIGIPAACMLHGYVGFLFGAIKANPWWSTPLMPIIFLFSAVVSGIALLVIMYQVIMKYSGWIIDQKCLASLARWLWLFLIMTVTLEVLEIISLSYKQAEEWEIIKPLLSNQLSISFIGIQMIMGSLIPFILLMVVVILDKFLHERVRNTLTFIAALLLMMQVFAMRWNVVIGGQTFSKSMRGFKEYIPHFFEKEGVGASIIIMILPFIALTIMLKILPTFKNVFPVDTGDDNKK